MGKKLLFLVFLTFATFLLSSWNGFGQCTASVTITSNDSDNTICADSEVIFTATPSNGGSNPLFQWRVNGVNVGANSSVNTYTTSDLKNGQVVSVRLTSDIANCATVNPVVSNNITTTVNPLSTVNAGGAIPAICQGGTTTALAGSYGGGATSAIWSDGGAGGSFSNNSGSNPSNTTYTASATAPASITLTLTTAGGSCGTVSASKTLTVNQNPTVSVGSSLTAICQGETTTALGGSYGGGATSAVWSDGGAGGTFTNNSGSSPNNTTYTASASAQASITLTLSTVGGTCGSVQDSKTLAVNPNPTVSAGGAIAAICQGGTTGALNGSYVGGATSAVWSDGGVGGTFSNNSGGTPNTATYTAGENAPATVTLTLTTGGGSCGTVSATKTLTVNQNPTVSAGAALSAICQGATTPALGGSFGGGATSAVWSDGGAGGSFTNNSGSNPGSATYTTATNAPNSVTLTLTTVGGSCQTVSASKTITVNPTPTVNIGGAIAAICQGGTTGALGGSYGGGATSAVWSANVSGGNFSNNTGNSPNTATYTAPANAPSSIILTLTTAGGSCGAVSATKTVTVNPTKVPSVTITASSTNICTTAPSGSTPVTFIATPVNGGATPSYQWKNGSTNVGTNSATYTSNSLAAGSKITVEMTSNAVCPAPTKVTSNEILMTTFTSTPSNWSGGTKFTIPASLCPPATGIPFSIPSVANAEYYVWTLPQGFTIASGEGTNNITVNVGSNATVGKNQPITVQAFNPCGSNSLISDKINIDSFTGVTVPSPTATVCAGNSISVVGTLTGNAASGTWTAPSGSFTNIVTSNTNPTTVTATYIPSIITGTVDLTITTNAPAGSGCSNSPGTAKITLTVNQQPSITTQPIATQTLCSGTSATMSAAATGTGLTYQWKKGGTNVPGATSSTLTLNNITTANAGNYTVVVSGVSPCTSVTSSVSELKVNQAVAITAQPVATQTICSGTAANFSVTATGTGLTYQWKKDGTDIANATSSTLPISNTTSSNSGNYTVVVTGTSPCTSVTSSVSTLTVNDAVVITAQPIATQTICSGVAATFSVEATGTSLTYQWKKGGSNITNATSSTYTIPSSVPGDSGNYTVVVSGVSPCAAVTSSVASLTVNTPSVAPTSLSSSVSSVCNGANSSVTLSQTSGSLGTGAVWKWYTDQGYTNSVTGTVDNNGNLSVSPTTTTTYYLRAENTTSPCNATADGPSSGVTVTVNEPSVAPTALSASSSEICNGNNTTVTLSKTGGSLGTDAVWKWYTNSNYTTPVSGPVAEDGSITVSPTTTTTYYIRAENTTEPCNVNVNGPAAGVTITVNEPVAITTDLDDSEIYTVCAGFPIEFSIEATGTGLTYEWTRDGQPVGTNSPTLNIAQAAASDTGKYKVLVKGLSPCSDVSSKEVELEVNQSITFSNGGQPTAEIKSCEGDSSPITISVTAEGTISEYLWRKDNIPLSDGGNISGATTAELTISNQSPDDSGSYDVVISSPAESCSQIISNPAVVTVNPAPAITSIGENIILCSISEGVNITSGVEVANESTILWSVPTGMGSITNANSLTTATYSPGNASGTIELTLTVQGLEGCSEIIATKNITIVPQPVITEFSYLSGENTATSAEFCETDNNTYTPHTEGENLTNGSGIFSVDNSALTVNTSTGAITPNGTEPGEYLITYRYTVDSQTAGCTVAEKSFTVTIGEKPIADFSFENTPFCSNAGNPLPVMANNAVKGKFTSSTGLVFIDDLTGEINIAGSTPGTYTITNTIAAANGCVEVKATSIIVINQRPDAPGVTDVAYCHNTEGAPALTATTATGATLNWYETASATTALTAAPTPNTATVTNTPLSYWVSQTSAEGCESERAEIKVTINALPTVTISAPAGVTLRDNNPVICNGSSIILTGNGATDYSWSTDSANLGAGSTMTVSPIVTTTYFVTGTDGNGCSKTSQITIQVDPVSVAGTITGPTAVCINNASGQLVLEGFTGNIVKWESKAASATTWSVLNSGDIASTQNYSNLTQTTTFRATVKSGVCSETTVEKTITIDPLPIGGKLAFDIVTANNDGRIFTICQGATTGYKPINLTGQSGTILAWKYSINGAAWVTIAGETGNSLSADKIKALNLSATTVFRVEIGSGACTPNAFSQTAILSVIATDITPTPVTVSKDVICLGDIVTLSSETGYNALTPTIEDGTFDNAGIKNNGWRFRNNGAHANFETNANNVRPDFWSRATPRDFPTASITSPYGNTDQRWAPGNEEGNKGFAITSGAQTNATMETNTFSIGSMDQAILTFDQAFNLTPGATIKVEISREGGNTYEKVLFTRTGSATSGNYANFGTVNNATNKMVLDLGDYLGQSNLRIKFSYTGTRTGDIWAVDAIKVPSGPRGITIEWNDYTVPGEIIPIGTTNSVNYAPKNIGLNIFEVKTKLIFDTAGNACDIAENSENIEVFVFDKYTTSVTAEYGSCGVFEAQLSAKVLNGKQELVTSYPTPDGYIGKWVVVGTGATLVDSNPADGIDAINDPNAILSTTSAGTYNVSWILEPTAEKDGQLYARPNPDICLTTVTPVDVIIQGCIALDFDGVDDYVDLGVNYAGNDYSFEAWVKPASEGGTIISGPQFNITAPASLSTTRWTHIAVSDGILYLDGVASGTPPSGSVGTRALIGASWDGTAATDFFHGYIEEVRIWNGTITPENIRFTMNQRLKGGIGNIGEVVDMAHPDAPIFANLAGYYRLISAVPDPANLVTHDANLLPTNGTTIDLAVNAVPGVLKNMTTNQENTAPLPYFTGNAGAWDTSTTWARPTVWNIPNTNSINWNIVKLLHNVNSPRDVSVLGIISENGVFDMEGNNPTGWVGGGTGNELYISHYLLLSGIIDLNGESQLVQPMLSIVDGNSTGSLQRDQQGTANSYNYNYWSSPVSPGANNAPYTVAGVLRDGSTLTPGSITFGDPHTFADAGPSTIRKISNYWIATFNGTADNYGSWNFRYGSANSIKVGEGYTMKGTSGSVGLSTAQNYTFVGLPNNGNINLPSFSGRNYLIGNPYPSAINVVEFIDDNLSVRNNGQNNFDGAIYLWNHFGQVDSHVLKEYVGGYATLNKGGAVPAISFDDRINDNMAENDKIPGLYIPVGQGFFVNTLSGDEYTISDGQIKFKNSQREFVTEVDVTASQFLKPEVNIKNSKVEDVKKIRISFRSPLGYNRQILVGAIPTTTNGFDLGYDAQVNDYNLEDMYWIQGNNWLVIQGVPDFGKDQILPLGIRIDQTGDFTIKIDKLENMSDNHTIYLKDKVLDTIHDLRAGDYKSSSEPGEITDRFQLIFFKEKSTPDPDPIEGDPVVEVPEIDPIIVDDLTEISLLHSYTENEMMVLNPKELEISAIYLFDMNGKLLSVFDEVPTEKEIRLKVNNFSNGTYILKMHTEDQIINRKIIIRE